jgi:hypothetical protein
VKKGISGVPGSKNDARRCTATANRSGERCKAPAIKGGNVCRMHGGSLPGVKKAAKDRLLEMVEPAMIELRKIIDRADTSDADKLRAIQMVLDRAGFRPGVDISVGMSKWEETLEDIFIKNASQGGGTDRSSMEDPPEEHWEDFHQAAYDAQGKADRERDDAEAKRGRIQPEGHTVVRGEVVDNDPPAYGGTR